MPVPNGPTREIHHNTSIIETPEGTLYVTTMSPGRMEGIGRADTPEKSFALAKRALEKHASALLLACTTEENQAPARGNERSGEERRSVTLACGNNFRRNRRLDNDRRAPARGGEEEA